MLLLCCAPSFNMGRAVRSKSPGQLASDDVIFLYFKQSLQPITARDHLYDSNHNLYPARVTNFMFLVYMKTIFYFRNLLPAYFEYKRWTVIIDFEVFIITPLVIVGICIFEDHIEVQLEDICLSLCLLASANCSTGSPLNIESVNAILKIVQQSSFTLAGWAGCSGTLKWHIIQCQDRHYSLTFM